MNYDSQHFVAAFEEWRMRMEGYQLPAWEDFPALELYMDQVTVLINQYLEPYETDRNSDSTVTPAMINNYVKMKIVPPPVKKRYTKIHLAYLVMVCMLKQTLSMEMIRRVIPVDLEEQEVRAIYQTFVNNQKGAFGLLLDLLNKEALTTLAEGQTGEVRDMMLQAAIFSNLSRALTRLVLTLPEKEENKP